MFFMTMMRLMWEMWTAECTRCGGYGHTLSQCRWPAVTQGCGGDCNQGRKACTCRKQ